MYTALQFDLIWFIEFCRKAGTLYKVGNPSSLPLFCKHTLHKKLALCGNFCVPCPEFYSLVIKFSSDVKIPNFSSFFVNFCLEQLQYDAFTLPADVMVSSLAMQCATDHSARSSVPTSINAVVESYTKSKTLREMDNCWLSETPSFIVPVLFLVHIGFGLQWISRFGDDSKYESVDPESQAPDRCLRKNAHVAPREKMVWNERLNTEGMSNESEKRQDHLVLS